MTAIQVTEIGKAYKKYSSRWNRLIEWLAFNTIVKHDKKWILRNITFSVKRGEAIGIIGINGAGKSTLLKLITGTIIPTEGSIKLSGRVASLLELGLGFHPEFTGRQNIKIAAQMLGIKNEELKDLMPDIEDFAEIAEYIDQPIRVYSSGMQVRLAFSLATAIRPDILIIDEALSVGDVYFQHKSFERIKEYRSKGTTLIIVSHDKQAILSICDSAILLDSGSLALKGDPEVVMDYYNAKLSSNDKQISTNALIQNGKIQTVSGTGEAKVISIKIIDNNGDLKETIEVGEKINIEIKIKINENIEKLVLGYAIKNTYGQVVYGTNTEFKKKQIVNLVKGSNYVFNISFIANLGVGAYSIATALVGDETHLNNNYEWRDFALLFNVININKTKFDGMVWLDSYISVELE
jgi:lipopolysaccharide transport system ATP-binding protein